MFICYRVPSFKWMSSWKPSGDAAFLRVSSFCPIFDFKKKGLFVVVSVAVIGHRFDMLLRWYLYPRLQPLTPPWS